MIKNKGYSQFLEAWKTAALELKLKIEIPFSIKLENEKEILVPLRIENFGSNQGTIVSTVDEMLSFKLLQQNGFYCSALDTLSYSVFDRDLFIDTLNDWGFYGDSSDQPDWYTGCAWGE